MKEAHLKRSGREAEYLYSSWLFFSLNRINLRLPPGFRTQQSDHSVKYRWKRIKDAFVAQTTILKKSFFEQSYFYTLKASTAPNAVWDFCLFGIFPFLSLY